MKKLICYSLVLAAIVLISCSDNGINNTAGNPGNVTDFAYTRLGNNLIYIKLTSGNEITTRCFLTQSAGNSLYLVQNPSVLNIFSLDTISAVTITKLTAPYTFWFRRMEQNVVLNSECCSQVSYKERMFFVKTNGIDSVYRCSPATIFNFADTCEAGG